MKESYTSKKRVRKNFGRIDAVIDMPSLIEVQTGSYNSFINNVDMYGNHCEFGLEEVFKSIFPIRDFSGNGVLEFVKYELSQPKYDVEECMKRDQLRPLTAMPCRCIKTRKSLPVCFGIT